MKIKQYNALLIAMQKISDVENFANTLKSSRDIDVKIKDKLMINMGNEIAKDMRKLKHLLMKIVS